MLKSVIGIYYSTARHQREEIQQLWPNSILSNGRQALTMLCVHTGKAITLSVLKSVNMRHISA